MTDPRERLDYLQGGMLAAEDYERAQAFLIDGQAIRCRSLHTWGIASGLEVRVQAGLPAVSVSAGMAVDVQGRQIVLTQARIIDLSREVTPQLYLTIAYGDRYDDWRIYRYGAGYGRREDEPQLLVSAQPPSAGGAAIALARLSFTPEWRLQAPDLSLRRYCGLEVGALAFPRPGLASDGWPTLAIDGHSGPLKVASPLTDIFGSVAVEGRVAVGLPAASTAALAVQAQPAQTRQGLISNAGALIYGAQPGALAGVRPGDTLQVGEDAEQQQTLRVASAADDHSVVVSEAPATSFQNAPFAVSPSLVARIQTGELAVALVIDAQGHMGIGGQPSPGAALTVTGGDIQLDQSHVVRFAADGAVQAGGETHALNFLASQSLLDVREAGDIVFILGDADPQATPAMVLTQTGNMGIGVADPPSRLTVNGLIRASQGLKFPDGTVQTDAVVPIPVGTVVDWWRPNSSVSWSGDAFQLCDGSTITDPASPLVGQKTPDLREMFVWGVVSFEDIGSTGGAETHTHGYSMSQHTHGIVHVHPVVGATGGPQQSAGDRIAGSSISNSDHTHVIDTVSGGASPAVTALNAPSPPGTTDAASNLPPYVSLLKVMRIK